MSDEKKSTKPETKSSEQFPWEKSWEESGEVRTRTAIITYKSTQPSPRVHTITLKKQLTKQSVSFVIDSNIDDPGDSFSSAFNSFRKNTDALPFITLGEDGPTSTINYVMVSVYTKEKELNMLSSLLQVVAKCDPSVECIRQNILLDLDPEYFKGERHAFLMGLHPRVGEVSSVQELKKSSILEHNLLPMIFGYAKESLEPPILPHRIPQGFFSKPPSTTLATRNEYAVGAIKARLTDDRRNNMNILFELAESNAYTAHVILTTEGLNQYIFPRQENPPEYEIENCKMFLWEIAKTHVQSAELILTTDALRKRLLVGDDSSINETLTTIAKSHSNSETMKTLCEQLRPNGIVEENKSLTPLNISQLASQSRYSSDELRNIRERLRKEEDELNRPEEGRALRLANLIIGDIDKVLEHRSKEPKRGDDYVNWKRKDDELCLVLEQSMKKFYDEKNELKNFKESKQLTSIPLSKPPERHSAHFSSPHLRSSNSEVTSTPDHAPTKPPEDLKQNNAPTVVQDGNLGITQPK